MFFTVVHCVAFILAGIVQSTPQAHDPDFDGYDISNPSVILPTVAFTLWGLSDAMINAFLYWIIGLLYQSGPDKARAIGLFKLLNSAAHVLGYVMISSNVSADTQLWYNVVAYLLGAATA